jgi:hypothetical protein
MEGSNLVVAAAVSGFQRFYRSECGTCVLHNSFCQGFIGTYHLAKYLKYNKQKIEDHIYFTGQS